MFQSVYAGVEVPCKEAPADKHVESKVILEPPTINILFQYNKYMSEPLSDPNDIVRPHRPLNLI